MTVKRERTEIATSNPSLAIVVTDDGSRTLKCLESGVTWHSESGALAESRLVFLENSGVARKFAQHESIRILEIGFGTGLNFWITASRAMTGSTRLEYVSLEPNLLDLNVFGELEHRQLGECQPAFDRFFPLISRPPGSKVAEIVGSHNGVRLTIHLRTFEPGVFQDLQLFDAVYHDPFGPESASDLWTTAVFQFLFILLKPGGKLVTYCVKSEIQRRLKDAGFLVQKTRGPLGGKREVLIATRV